MHAHILVIEDTKEMAELVALYLQKEGMTVETVETAEEGLGRLQQSPFDLIVLDINLPGMDGFQFLTHLRREYSIPVLIVSARNEDEDIITGLGYGADEFVTKPFSPKVLVARIRALLRRIQEKEVKGYKEGSVFTFGPFTLYTESCVLRKGEEIIHLSTKEYGVLEYLARHSGKPKSPEAIYNAVWKNTYGDLTTVAVYIQRLRKKIEEDPANPQYIETVHGMGYRFNPSGNSFEPGANNQ
ncbi:response regulator transcription factor [Treponema sp. J25]|uniref:response regulator transcription factor n=1 Tax=Treponema sp. J25 TaxID=2094121 RepID=UPI00104BD322|nr:response regulator transcription factor [Treponema sp. J25]TCW60506.1 DNA-binding response regulator [Treponema sp. J25]